MRGISVKLDPSSLFLNKKKEEEKVLLSPPLNDKSFRTTFGLSKT